MSRWAVLALRIIVVIALLGSVAVQALMIAALWMNGGTGMGIRLSLVVIGVLGIVCLQVTAVCIWQLLIRVRRGTVFAHDSFRYVDIVIGAVSAAAALVLAVAVVARFANHNTPGDAVAPGLVGMICGLALVVAGVALVVYVLRALLAQAVALDAETRHLQSELDGVI